MDHVNIACVAHKIVWFCYNQNMNKYDGMVEVVGAPIIVNKKGEILFVKSHKWGDKYIIPGGHAEAGETIFETAAREGEEETGLKLKPLYCINIGELIYNPEFAWMDPKEVLEQKLNFSDGIEKSVYNFINGIKFNIESSNFKK